ncbi:MAG: hypothetical protein ACOYNF_03455 [Rhodoferax sp.]
MKYTTVAVLTLPAGAVLGLTEAQASTRSHVLQCVPARKGWYNTTAAVQFKIGEEIQIEGDLPPILAHAVQDAAATAAAAEHKVKAKKAKANTPSAAPEQV